MPFLKSVRFTIPRISTIDSIGKCAIASAFLVKSSDLKVIYIVQMSVELTERCSVGLLTVISINCFIHFSAELMLP